MIKWYFCAKLAWVWFVTKVLMHQHLPHEAENRSSNLKMKMFPYWAPASLMPSSQPSLVYLVVCMKRSPPCLLCLLCLPSDNDAPVVWPHIRLQRKWEGLMAADGGGIRPGDNISDGRLGKQYEMRDMENTLKERGRWAHIHKGSPRYKRDIVIFNALFELSFVLFLRRVLWHYLVFVALNVKNTDTVDFSYPWIGVWFKNEIKQVYASNEDICCSSRSLRQMEVELYKTDVAAEIVFTDVCSGWYHSFIN